MKVLIACEESQEVCKAFRAKGHEAYSCDILPCSGGHPEWHIQDDVTAVLGIKEWDLIIAHPPCTYLCNSGVRWLKGDPNRYEQMVIASEFFKRIFTYRFNTYIKICVENPIPHKHGGLPKYSQIIQPFQFGHGERKATCLWLYNLPELRPTNIVEGRKQRIWKMPPSADRTKIRSKTFPGIAAAMAEQWG